MLGTYPPRRMTGRSSRSLLAALAALGATFAVPTAWHPAGGPVSRGGASGLFAVAAAHADEGAPQVGARLVAVVDVELDEAVVRAGSHVSVVGKKAQGGRVLLDVALADGHVVRGVPLHRVRTSFREA
jgi:hypothetical protein